MNNPAMRKMTFNPQTVHDMQSKALYSTAECPRIINACGPRQDQVKMNMHQKRSEGITSHLEGGAPHLSRFEEDHCSLIINPSIRHISIRMKK
jgi:hypothetical protein